MQISVKQPTHLYFNPQRTHIFRNSGPHFMSPILIQRISYNQLFK